MTDQQQHPIAPPHDQVYWWWEEACKRPPSSFYEKLDYVAERAAQWGADQELDACCEFETKCYGEDYAAKLRRYRRPQLKSRKQRALDALAQMEDIPSSTTTKQVIMLTKNTDQLRRVVAEHFAQDAIVQGTYWDKEAARGCFIGCLAHSVRPELNEHQYGLPVMLQRIAESIFEALPADEAKGFFAALPDAVGCNGKDLTKVGWQFLAFELRSMPQQSPEIQAVINPVIVDIERLAVGQEWHKDTAWAAATAARAAWAAAQAARAAWAATRAAWAADAAARAAWAAADAADAAAWAADAADAAAWAATAVDAARRRQRDLLLRLIAEAPVVERLQELEGQDQLTKESV